MINPADAGVLLVLLGAVCSGLRPLFARLLIDDGVTAAVTALYCYSGSLLLFLPLGIKELQGPRHQKRAAGLAVISGLFVGAGGAAYFEALSRFSVATVTLIYFSYPALVIFVLAALRRRWPQPRAWWGIFCVSAGIVLIVGNGIGDAGHPPVDYLIAFIAPFSWTVLLIFLGGPLTLLKPYSRIGFITLGAVSAMGLAVAARPPPALLARTPSGWIGLLGMILISGVLCHVLTTLGVQRAGAERASFAGVFEIATSLAVGWLIFTEPMTIHQAAGLCLIVSALFLTRRLDIGVSGSS